MTCVTGRKKTNIKKSLYKMCFPLSKTPMGTKECKPFVDKAKKLSSEINLNYWREKWLCFLRFEAGKKKLKNKSI
jgi:hypothetical protein